MRKTVLFASLAAMVWLGVPGASAAPVQLIASAPAGADVRLVAPPRTASRARLVSLNSGALFDGTAPRQADAMPEIAFDLFGNARFTGVVKQVAEEGGAVTWSGELKDVGKGYFYVVSVDGVVIAHVASARGVYEISNAGGGLYRVIELDQRKNREDAPGKIKVGTSISKGQAAARGAKTLDIVVFYTDDARAAEGSSAAMRARVALAVAETNGAYQQSGVTTRLRLVHTEEVSYYETGSIGTDLTAFRTSGDGVLDQVQGVRDAFGADMAQLIVEKGGDYCGIATSIMASADNAYAVTARDCATGYYSFGHELGHLQGLRHDIYVDKSTRPFAYGHGFAHPSVDAPDSWRTIMAYGNACWDAGYDCTRLQFFSNPVKVYRWAQMGSAATANNARVLDETAATVAAFRPQSVGADFSWKFNNTNEGWKPVTTRGAAWKTSGGIASTKGKDYEVSSVRSVGRYGDVTFSARMRQTGGDFYGNFLFLRGNSSVTDGQGFWEPSYMFTYSDDGYFAVFKQSIDKAGQPSLEILANWQKSAAIRGNDWNTLKVVAVGNTFRFFINGVQVWEGMDPNPLPPVGEVGIGMFGTADLFEVDEATLTNTPASGNVPEPGVVAVAKASSPARGSLPSQSHK